YYTYASALALLLHEGLCPPRQLLRRHILNMRSNRPKVPSRIFDSAMAVTIELIGRLHMGRGAGLKGALVYRVHIVHIQIHAGWHRLILVAGVPYHDGRVTDLELGV